MKRSVFIILAIVLCSCTRNLQPTSLSEDDLSGEVRSVTTTCYNATMKSGEIVRTDSTERYLVEYDRDGYRLHEEWHDYMAGSCVQTDTEWNEDKLMAGQVDSDGRGNIICKTLWFYSDQRLEKRELYDGMGRMFLCERCVGKDEHHRKTETRDSTGMLVSRNEYTYDEKDRIVDVKKFECDFLVRHNLYEYDSNGLLVHEADTSDNCTSDIVYAYNGGVLTEKSEDLVMGYGMLQERTIMNEFGDPVRREPFGEYAGMCDFHDEYSYTYDSCHNWIVRITTRTQDNTLSYSVEQRRIEYY